MKLSGGKKKYPIKRIEIEERDPSIFADLALFFDREDALGDIADLRKSWIGEKIISHDQIDDFINGERSLDEARAFWNKYWPQVYRIAKKYGLRENFVRPIVAAVLSGVVVEGDYRRAFEQHPIDNLPDEFRLSEKTVFLSNNVRDIDLRGLSNKIDDKSITRIKRDREWYWLYQESGMGYKRLSKAVQEPMQTVRTAINSYKHRLRDYYRVV